METLCGMVAMWTILVSMIIAVPMINRSSYGIIFAEIREIQNSGSDWMAHLYTEPLPDQIVPDEICEYIVMKMLCYKLILSANQT